MSTLKIFIAGTFLLFFMGSKSYQAIAGGKPGSSQKPDYRHVGHRAYEILDTAGFYLYRYNKLVQGEKIARPANVYYFSVNANDSVQELTMVNLEKAFAANTKFRYSLESQFRSDKDLIAYDGLSKAYKIKYLYDQSFK